MNQKNSSSEIKSFAATEDFQDNTINTNKKLYATSPLKRMFGTMRMDVQVINEIKDTSTLHLEAKVFSIASLTVISIFQLLSIFNVPDRYEIDSATGTVFKIFIDRYVGFFVYLFLLSWVSRNVIKESEMVDIRKLMQMVSYIYVLLAISRTILFIGLYANILLVQYLFALVFLYFSIVYFYVLKQTTRTSYVDTIIIFVIALFGMLVFQFILDFLIDLTFGGSYTQ